MITGYKDFLGNAVGIGDFVVFVAEGYRGFSIGKVISITDKQVNLLTLASRHNGHVKFRQYHKQTIWCDVDFVELPERFASFVEDVKE